MRRQDNWVAFPLPHYLFHPSCLFPDFLARAAIILRFFLPETVQGVREDRPERERRTSHQAKEETAEDVERCLDLMYWIKAVQMGQSQPMRLFFS